jgi:hypothetical protein
MSLHRSLSVALLALILAVSVSLAGDPAPAPQSPPEIEAEDAPEAPVNRTFNVDITAEEAAEIPPPTQAPADNRAARPMPPRDDSLIKHPVLDANMLLLFRAYHYRFNSPSGDYGLFSLSTLDIPFFDFTIWEDSAPRMVERLKAGQPLGDPLARICPVDQPLISLFSMKTLIDYSKDQPSTLAARVRYLDSLVFGLYQEDAWLDKQFVQTWGRFPLGIRTFERARTDLHTGLYVLDCEMFSILRSLRSQDFSDVRFADTFLAGVFTYNRRKDSKQWNALSVPFVSAADWRTDEVSTDLTLLGTRSENTSLPGPGKRPLLALWYSTREFDGDSAHEVLRLPLFGPLFSHWKQDDVTHWHMLPRIITWGKYPY